MGVLSFIENKLTEIHKNNIWLQAPESTNGCMLEEDHEEDTRTACC